MSALDQQGVWQTLDTSLVLQHDLLPIGKEHPQKAGTGALLSCQDSWLCPEDPIRACCSYSKLSLTVQLGLSQSILIFWVPGRLHSVWWSPLCGNFSVTTRMWNRSNPSVKQANWELKPCRTRRSLLLSSRVLCFSVLNVYSLKHKAGH